MLIEEYFEDIKISIKDNYYKYLDNIFYGIEQGNGEIYYLLIVS